MTGDQLSIYDEPIEEQNVRVRIDGAVRMITRKEWEEMRPRPPLARTEDSQPPQDPGWRPAGRKYRSSAR